MDHSVISHTAHSSLRSQVMDDHNGQKPTKESYVCEGQISVITFPAFFPNNENYVFCLSLDSKTTIIHEVNVT